MTGPSRTNSFQSTSIVTTNSVRIILCAAGWIVSAWGIAGCRSTEAPTLLPASHSIRSEQLLVMSDFKLPKDHALIEDLTQLRNSVASRLDLPLRHEEVVVYLFSNREQYREFLTSAYPRIAVSPRLFRGNTTRTVCLHVLGRPHSGGYSSRVYARFAACGITTRTTLAGRRFG